MAAAYTLVRVLERAGANLTRAGVMKQVRSLNIASNPFLLPGITIKTGGSDQFPIEQMQLQRWEGKAWRAFGGLWGYRAA
jgi:branched-chain amino acid transport system substrate-binding protein